MSRLSRLSRTVARWTVRLVPAGRREWAEALWAEADQMPPGLARVKWQVGGIRIIAGQARLARLAVWALAFAGAAAWIVHVAWPGPASNPATGVNRLNVVALLPVLAVLPLLARWQFGTVAGGRLTRVLRVGAYAAVLLLMLAKAVVEPVADDPAGTRYLNQDASSPVKDGMIATWLAQSLFLLAVATYVAVILALTARRARVARGTLAVGTGAGLALGAVMYAIFPLGLSSDPTNPRLPGYAAGLLVALAWVLLLGGPILAGVVAARRVSPEKISPDKISPDKVSQTRIRQAVAAGFLATAVGALAVAVAGSATVALLPRAAWLQHWLYPDQRLSGFTAYIVDLTASDRVQHYALCLLIFPVIGLLLSLAAGVATDQRKTPGSPTPGNGGPPRPPGYTPAPDPPGPARPRPGSALSGAQRRRGTERAIRLSHHATTTTWTPTAS